MDGNAEDVSEFLLRIRELGDRRDREDDERARKLEAEILAGREARRARREGMSHPSFIYRSRHGSELLLTHLQNELAPSPPRRILPLVRRSACNQACRRRDREPVTARMRPNTPTIPQVLPWTS